MYRYGVFQSNGGRWSKTLPVLCCAVIFGACGAHQGQDRVKSPIVALVNDRPITVSQLNQLTQSSDQFAPAQAIESLVNEELLVQGAEKQQMASDPAVAQAIDTARRRILARAFAERNLYVRQKVSSTEAQDFYSAHPILFENRKRFLLKNYLIEGTELDSQLMDALENVHSDTDLRDLLDKHNTRYTTRVDALSADQLPHALDKASDFEHAAMGDVITARQGDGRALLMLITGIQNDAPLSFDHAKPYIKAYLSNMHNRQALSEYLAHAKTAAKIIYADDLKPGPIGVVGVSLMAKTDEAAR